MADEITKADIDAAVEKATKALTEKLETLESKNTGLLDDLKKAQRELRAAKDVTPEAHQAEVERADKAEAKVKELEKAAKDATTRAEKAEKAAEELGESYKLAQREAAISAAVAKGNVAEGYVDAYTALVEKRAVTEFKDGKWATTVDGKEVGEWTTENLASDAGKHFKSAAQNSGGGAPGGSGGSGGGKTATRAEFDAMDHGTRMTFSKEGGKVVDQAA